jgi:hypothetical protein
MGFRDTLTDANFEPITFDRFNNANVGSAISRLRRENIALHEKITPITVIDKYVNQPYSFSFAVTNGMTWANPHTSKQLVIKRFVASSVSGAGALFGTIINPNIKLEGTTIDATLEYALNQLTSVILPVDDWILPPGATLTLGSSGIAGNIRLTVMGEFKQE